MKTKIRSAIAVIGIACAGQSLAGIPVIDGVSNGMRIAEFAQTVVQWGKEIAEMQAQYQQMVTQYESMTGSRGYSDLLSDSQHQQARRYLPDNAADIIGLANNTGGYSSLHDALASIKQESTILDSNTFGSETAAIQWNAEMDRAATNKAVSMAAYSAAAQRMANMETLLTEISQTEDPKAIAELQSRINAEQGFIQNEQAKLQALSMLVSAEQQISQQQARETSIRMAGRVADVPRVQVTP